MRRRFVLLLGLVAMFALVGCSKNDTQTKKYLELVDSPSTTLDNVWYNPGGIFRCAIFESLLLLEADMTTMKCALAEKYDISEDNLTYSFTLRDDVKWHDGEKFDGQDVVFSIKMALRSPEINGIITSAFGYIEGAEDYATGKTEQLSGVVAEKNKVSIQLTQPIGSFLEVIAQFAILPEHLLSDVTAEQLSTHEYWKKPIGCGCYKITEAVEGEYFILEAYKDYYGKQAGIEKIRLRVNVEDCVEEMKAGTLDFYVTNDPEEIAKLKGTEHNSEHQLNILFPTYLLLNLSDDEGVNEALKDVRVRKALLLAIDRETIVDAIFPGSSVTDTLIPAWDSWYLENAEEYSFNPEKAKELLTEANFDFSKTIRLRYSKKGQSTTDLINAIAVYWRAIGIQVEVDIFEGSGSEHMFHIRDFDVCYKRLSVFDYASIYGEVHGDGIMQTNLFGQPVYDELIDELEITVDETDRKELIAQMQELDQQYLLRLPLFALANVAYVNDTNFDMPNAYGNLWYRYNLRFSEWKLVN